MYYDLVTEWDQFVYRDDNIIVLTQSAGCNVSISCDVKYHDGRVLIKYFPPRQKHISAGSRVRRRWAPLGSRRRRRCRRENHLPLVHAKMSFRKSIAADGPFPPPLVREPRGEALLNDTRSATNAANSRIAMRRCVIKINCDYRGQRVDDGG